MVTLAACGGGSSSSGGSAASGATVAGTVDNGVATLRRSGDDGALIHERIGTAYKNSSGIGGFPSYAWQYVLMPFFAAIGVFILLFLWKDMPRTLDRAKVVAALGCFAVAVGLDFVEGLDDGYRLLVDATGWRPATFRHFSKSIEEFLEMLAVTIFLVTFLGHLASVAPRLEVRFIDADGKQRRRARAP